MEKLRVVEGFTEHGTPSLKYYAFDWDDNIMVMPTKIMVLDENGNEVGMSTEDFAEYRTQLGKDSFEYKGHTIVGMDPTTAFRNFRTDGDEQFKVDVFKAKKGPVWNDFVEAINGGSIFSIVTARGHSPLVIRKAIENLIDMNYKGISKKELVKNLRKFRDVANEEDMDDDQLIDAYMDMNKYYPVTYGSGSAQNPEKGKVIALKEFQNYVKYLSGRLNKSAMFKNDVSGNFTPSIGFSDDDLRNLEKVKDELGKEPDNIIKTISTHGGVKKPY
jgi:hypothetical protein